MNPISHCLVLFLFMACQMPERVEFEGIITYKIEVSSPKGSPFVGDFQKDLGETAEVYFKRGMYRMNFDGQPGYHIINLDSLSEQYTLFDNVDTLFVDDTSKEPRKIIGTNHEVQVDTILGMMCNKFNLEIENERKEFFYSPDLYISATRFKNHKFGHVDVYYKNCEAPFLKKVQYGRVFTITYEAIRIDPMKLSDSLFVPRTDLPTSSLNNK